MKIMNDKNKSEQEGIEQLNSNSRQAAIIHINNVTTNENLSENYRSPRANVGSQNDIFKISSEQGHVCVSLPVNELRVINDDDYYTELAREFLDKDVRARFIRKVYMLLTFCLGLNFGMVLMAMYIKQINDFYKEHGHLLLIISIGVTFAMMLLFCFETLRKKFPLNIILLFIYVVAFGTLLSVICIRYNIDLVLMSLAVTVIISSTLTVFAFITNIDFTKAYLYIIIGVVVVFLFIIIQLFIKDQTLNLIIAILIVLLFSFKLIFDTQCMIGGKFRYVIHPSEYVCAALNLYLDILNIFLAFLQIFGEH